MTTIEPLGPADFELVARWLSNPDITRWLTAEWREKTATATIIAIAVRNRRNRLFLVRFAGEPCGLVALSDIDTADGTGMAWYLLGERQFGGRGIITDALRQLVSLAFRELGLVSVHAWAMEPNVASLRVLAKSGFQHAGRLRQSARLNGVPKDRLYFDVTAADAGVTSERNAAAVAAAAT